MRAQHLKLATRWREIGDSIEPFNGGAAAAFRQAARDLEESLEDDEPITPAEAEAEGLCNAETVRRAVREGRAENVGSPGKVQVRRGEVPGGNGRRRKSFEEIARDMVRNRSER